MSKVVGLVDAIALEGALGEHVHERVAVLGVPCAGKSTLVDLIPGAQDMDALLFPQLTAEEKAIVFRKPWVPEGGIEMKRLARERIVVAPGSPVFATVLLDVDFVIYLQISDGLLRRRLARKERPQPFELCKGVQGQLEADIAQSGIPHLIYELKEENHGR